MITSLTCPEVVAFCRRTSSRKASVIANVISKPTSEEINVSSKSSKKSSSISLKSARNSFKRSEKLRRVFSIPLSYFSMTIDSFVSSCLMTSSSPVKARLIRSNNPMFSPHFTLVYSFLKYGKWLAQHQILHLSLSHILPLL